jgi:hypothetical protein
LPDWRRHVEAERLRRISSARRNSARIYADRLWVGLVWSGVLPRPRRGQRQRGEQMKPSNPRCPKMTQNDPSARARRRAGDACPKMSENVRSWAILSTRRAIETGHLSVEPLGETNPIEPTEIAPECPQMHRNTPKCTREIIAAADETNPWRVHRSVPRPTPPLCKNRPGSYDAGLSPESTGPEKLIVIRCC